MWSYYQGVSNSFPLWPLWYC